MRDKEEVVTEQDVVMETMIFVTKNTADPEMGGFFAYDGYADPERMRGFGYTKWDAVQNLAELMEEKDRPMIKPCPFCFTQAGCGVQYMEQHDAVTCNTCNVYGPTGFSEVDAIEKWNQAEVRGVTRPEPMEAPDVR